MDTNHILKITPKAPSHCIGVKCSFKKMDAKTMVEMSPIPEITAKFEELIRLMASDMKYDGITVAQMAIKNPSNTP